MSDSVFISPNIHDIWKRLTAEACGLGGAQCCFHHQAFSDVSSATGWLLEPRLWYIRRGMALFMKPEHCMGKECVLKSPKGTRRTPDFS